MNYYINTYNIEEIRSLISFYKSPNGKSILQKQNNLSMQVISEFQKIGGKIGYKIGKNLENNP